MVWVVKWEIQSFTTNPIVYFLQFFTMIGQLLMFLLLCVSKLFICDTGKEGQSYLVELDEHQATMKHVYQGLWKQSLGVMPFDTMKN